MGVIRRFTTFEAGLTIQKYWSSACPTRAMKPQCTSGVNLRITRWEHESILEEMQHRLDNVRNAARL